MTQIRDTLRPSVLVGLGKYGLFTAKKVMDAMTARHPAFATILRAVGLDESGKLWRLGANDTAVGSVANVRATLFPGIWHDNLAKIEAERTEMSHWLEEELTAVSDSRLILELREQGFQVEDGVDLFVFSTLFEPVGSAAIVPTLKLIGDIDTYKLSGTFVTVSCFLFFPDLFREYEREDMAYARSYATIQEIDALLDHPTATPIPVEYIWVFSSRNEENRFVASYNDVVSVITESIHLFTTRSILADTSFSAVLLRKVKGKTSRYSALGSSTFVFPLREIMGRLEHDVILEAMAGLQLQRDDRWDAGEMSLDVGSFLKSIGADDLDRSFTRDENGTLIWEPFQYKVPEAAGGQVGAMRAEILVRDLQTQIDAFRKEKLLKAQGGVLTRKRQLLKASTEAFQKHLAERLDRTPDSLRHSLAFLDELLNWDTPALSGESGPDAINLGRLLEGVKDRIRRLLDRSRDAEEEPAEAEDPDGPTPAERRATELALDDADPGRRRARMESHLKWLESEAQDTAFDLKAMEGRLQEAEGAADASAAKRRGFTMQYLVGIPAALGIVLGGLLWGLSGLHALKGKGMFLAEIWLGVMLLYGAVMYGRQGKALQESGGGKDEAARGLRGEKERLLKRLLEQQAAPISLRFERDLLEAQRSFLEDLIQHVARARRHLQDLINHMTGFRGDAEDERRRILLPSTPFVRSAVTWEEVDRWVSRHPRFRLEARSLFKVHALSAIYQGFVQTGSLAKLRVDMQQATEALFGYLRAMTLEEILVEMGLLPDGPAVARLKGCFDQAKAFISVDAEDVMDESATLVFTLMSRSKYGCIEDILVNHSLTEPSFYHSGDPHSLVVYRMKAGFPAFLMSSVRFCRAALNRLPDRPMYFVDPLGRLPTIYPTSYTVGDVDDEIRQIVCLGQAFGFLQEFSGGWWLNGQKLADSYEDLGEYLRRMAAAPVREDLKRMVMLCKNEAGAVTRLSSYLRERRVEHIDQSIIETTIRELSPLE